MTSEVYTQIQELLMHSKRPSQAIRQMLEGDVSYCPLLNHLKKLGKIEQNPKYHPEGSVLNHVLEVVDHGAVLKDKSRYPEVMMWAALLHDLGKLTTTKIRKGRITAYGHDEVGAHMARTLLKPLHVENTFKEAIVSLVRWHMQPFFVVKNLPFAHVSDMVRETTVDEVALLSLCDRMGRGELSSHDIQEAINMEIAFLEKCTRYMTSNEEIRRLHDMMTYLKHQVREDLKLIEVIQV